MFTALTERLSGVLLRLVGRGVLSEQDVADALRRLRLTQLEFEIIPVVESLQGR